MAVLSTPRPVPAAVAGQPLRLAFVLDSSHPAAVTGVWNSFQAPTRQPLSFTKSLTHLKSVSLITQEPFRSLSGLWLSPTDGRLAPGILGQLIRRVRGDR